MATETEVKILEIDPSRIRSLLRKNDARLVKDVLQENSVFKSPSHPGIMARVRVEGKDAFLTVKGKSREERGMKVVTEHETSVGNPAVVVSMLKDLGLRQVNYREIRREYYALHNCSVEICRVPGFPPYLEIEGTPRGIDKTAASLGYSKKDYDARGLAAIYDVPRHVAFKR